MTTLFLLIVAIAVVALASTSAAGAPTTEIRSMVREWRITAARSSRSAARLRSTTGTTQAVLAPIASNPAPTFKAYSPESRAGSSSRKPVTSTTVNAGISSSRSIQ